MYKIVFVFLMLAFFSVSGCEQEPEYFNKDIQEEYFKALQNKNIQYEKNCISCTVELTKKHQIEILFKNESDHPVPVKKSILLIDRYSGKKNEFRWAPFIVSCDDELVKYIGKLAYGKPLTIEDYIFLPPKETYIAKINLAKYYDLSKSGTYSVKYKGYNGLGFFDIKVLMKIESNTIEFKVD